MKFIKMLFISLVCLLMVVSCKNEKPNEDGLDKYRESGQLIDLDYDSFDKKLIDDESFVFFLKRNGCSSCAMFYPIVAEFLEENQNLKLYTLNYSEMGATNALTVSSYFISALGNRYYEDNGYETTSLYTPTICKIVKGEFIDVKIGVLNKMELGYMYQNNYLSIDTYYGYNRKVQNNETFNMFVSKNGDYQYDLLLREYFINNPNYIGNYLTTVNFDEDENTRLLNRINYYLGEESAIEILPDYFFLQYENGTLVNYTSMKYDTSLLNTLYNK